MMRRTRLETIVQRGKGPICEDIKITLTLKRALSDLKILVDHSDKNADYARANAYRDVIAAFVQRYR